MISRRNGTRLGNWRPFREPRSIHDQSDLVTFDDRPADPVAPDDQMVRRLERYCRNESGYIDIAGSAIPVLPLEQDSMGADHVFGPGTCPLEDEVQ
jgi:hypothetical protein